MAKIGKKLPYDTCLLSHVIKFTKRFILMDYTITKTKENLLANKQGFTLIELLVALAINEIRCQKCRHGDGELLRGQIHLPHDTGGNPTIWLSANGGSKSRYQPHNTHSLHRSRKQTGRHATKLHVRQYYGTN